MFKEKYTEINDEIRVSDQLKNRTIEKMTQTHPTLFNRKLLVGLSACCLLIVSVLTIPQFFPSNSPILSNDPVYKGVTQLSDGNDVYAVAAPNTFNITDSTLKRQVVEYKGLTNFTNLTTAQLITGKSNQSYSPVSFYLAMSGLSQIADSDSQTIFYDYLGVQDSENLKIQVNQLLADLLFEENFGQLSIHNAVWLDDSLQVDQAALETIASDYYFGSYQIDLQDNRSASLIGQWVADKSHGLIKEPFIIGEEALMEMMSVLYYKDQWKNVFNETFNEKLPFINESQTVTAEYMKKSYEGVAYRNDLFEATQLITEGRNEVILLLPTETTQVSQLADLETVNRLLESSQNRYKVTIQVPKFSFESEINLMDVIPESIKDNEKYQVQPEMKLGNAYQKNSFSFTENGIEASSLSVLEIAPTAAPPTEVETMNIIYNRPFMILVRDMSSKVITFVSVVYNPS